MTATTARFGYTTLNEDGKDSPAAYRAAINKNAALADSIPLAHSFGKCIIASKETRTNPEYGYMPTPDRVDGIVMPANGLICIAYQATWQASAGEGVANIFLNGSELVVGDNENAKPQPWPASASAKAIDKPLATTSRGLHSGAGAAAYTGDATTGQVVAADPIGGQGGACLVFAAAGTYSVGVQFRASAGSVTVKNRQLWVWSMF